MVFTKIDEHFMQNALEEAKKGVQLGCKPFGACITRYEEIISVAHNNVEKTHDISAHAEIEAIRRACKRLNTILLKDCVIYTTCEPCIMCLGAIFFSGMKKIYFGVNMESAMNSGFRQFQINTKEACDNSNTGIKLSGGLLEKEAEQLFTSWEPK